MNKEILLRWLLAAINEQSIIANSDLMLSPLDFDNESDALLELQSRRADAVTTVPTLSASADESLRRCRAHFNDAVAPISFVMARRFPESFHFFRPRVMEDEVLDGLAFFGELMDEFVLPFRRVGETGVDRYLALNDALCQFAAKEWPDFDARQRQSAVNLLLYDRIAPLFLNVGDYDRYWLVAGDQYESAAGDEYNWSGRKEMALGDVVFRYEMSPTKALVSALRVQDVWIDPFGAWNGVWITLEKFASISLSFSTMRSDPVLRDWGPVKRNFQGTRAEPIPHLIFNRLLELLPELKKHGLQPEPTASAPESGRYATEAEFEDKVLVPLLRRWDVNFDRQAPCVFPLGVDQYRGRIDFLIRDARGALAVIESKLRISNPRELQTAVEQARSYALMLAIPRFVIASPEGIWIYEVDGSDAKKTHQLTLADVFAQEAAVRAVLTHRAR